MRKEVILLNGNPYSYGPWDYQYMSIETGKDGEGNPTFEEVAMNPLPEGAVLEYWDMEFDNDIGWYKVGEKPEMPLTFEQDVRRTFTDLFKLLVSKGVIVVSEVPTYNEYDYRTEVQKVIGND